MRLGGVSLHVALIYADAVKLGNKLCYFHRKWMRALLCSPPSPPHGKQSPGHAGRVAEAAPAGTPSEPRSRSPAAGGRRGNAARPAGPAAHTSPALAQAVSAGRLVVGEAGGMGKRKSIEVWLTLKSQYRSSRNVQFSPRKEAEGRPCGGLCPSPRV